MHDAYKLKKISDFFNLFVECLFLPAVVSAALMENSKNAFVTFLWLITAFILYEHSLKNLNCSHNFGFFFFFYYLSTSACIFISVIFNKKSYNK